MAESTSGRPAPEPAHDSLTGGGGAAADGPEIDEAAGGIDVPPVPGPPPGVPDPDWPDDGRPPVNLGVMDPD